MNTEFDRNGLQVLCRALQVLNCDNRRLPLSVYRVMVALGEAGEAVGAYAVARRAGFLLEHGRVKLHEAKRLGVVVNVHVEGQGVLWVLTDKGRKELVRVLRKLRRTKDELRGEGCTVVKVDEPMLPGMELKKKRKRKNNG
ncbi:MAG: hypothetical protein IJN29_05340 [Akkermansia sp.]|nr:hypothetical protein [Akkermansia sp.]